MFKLAKASAIKARTQTINQLKAVLVAADPVLRLRWDQPTRDYLDRRINEGKTRREAIRCLKRYIARKTYQIITKPTSDTTERSAAA
jgi:hypothetical protein